MTLSVAVPTLIALLPMLAPVGGGSLLASGLIIGWSLVVLGAIGLAAWLVAQTLLKPLNYLTRVMNPASRGGGEKMVFESRHEPTELRLLRVAILGREAAMRREASERAIYVSTLIHDMKTPLLAVERSFGMLTTAVEPADQRRWLDAAHAEVKRILDLVQDVVDAERLASGLLKLNVEPLDLQELCAQVVKRLSPVRGDIRIDLSSIKSWQQQGDPLLLERAVENIVMNAVRHARTRVDVDLTPGLVRVADDGPGLPSGRGSPFESGVARAHASSSSHPDAFPRSAGLGLFIAKRILEAHGGRLVLESSGGHGTAFLLYVGAPADHVVTT